MEQQHSFSERGFQEPVGLDFKVLKSVFKRYWKTILFGLLFGFFAGVIYFEVTPKSYLISSTILIKDPSKESELKNIFREMAVTKKSNTIEDQIGLLKSYRLNKATLDNFNWNSWWSKRTLFSEKDLFQNEPFILKTADDGEQLVNVPLKITVLDDSVYRIQCDESVLINQVETEIEIDQKVKFGENFISAHFNFSLEKSTNYVPIEDDQFYLEFKDPNELANLYKEKILAEKFNPISESNLVKLQLLTNNPQRDVEYLNQLAAVYLQFGIDEKNRGADNAIKFIDDQISGVNKTLEAAGDRFSSFRASNRTVNLDAEATTVVEKQNRIEAEKTELLTRLDYYKNLKYYLENNNKDRNLLAPNVSGFNNEVLLGRVTRLNELYTKRQVLSLTAQDKSPIMISLDNEIAFTQKILIENVNSLLAQAEAEKVSLDQRERLLNSAISRLPGTEKNLIGIKRNFDLNNELYTFLLERRAEAEISKASNDANAQILDPATIDTAVLMGPLLFFNIFIGALGGLIFALMIVVVKYFSSDKIADAEEVQSLLDISLIGSVVQSNHKSEVSGILKNPRSALAESFRGLRINVAHLLKLSQGNIVAIHALSPGTGKSFVAFNLAVIFNLQKKKVLLIDGDLQKPRLHLIFNQKLEGGLSDFLKGTLKKETLVRKTEFESIDFISSGTIFDDSSEMLTVDKLNEFLDDFKTKYDLILFDNSPFGLVNDTRIIGSCAAINLFLLRLNHSRRSEIQEINRIGKLSILKGITAAVNGKQMETNHYYYNSTPSTKFIIRDLLDLTLFRLKNSLGKIQKSVLKN